MNFMDDSRFVCIYIHTSCQYWEPVEEQDEDPHDPLQKTLFIVYERRAQINEQKSYSDAGDYLRAESLQV